MASRCRSLLRQSGLWRRRQSRGRPGRLHLEYPGGVGIATAGLVATGKRTRDLVLLWMKVIVISGAAALAGYLLLDDASLNVGAFAQAFAAGAMLTMIVDTMIRERSNQAAQEASSPGS